MEKQDIVGPTLKKLYLALVDVGQRARLLHEAAAETGCSKPALKEALANDMCELDRWAEGLAAAMHSLDVMLPEHVHGDDLKRNMRHSGSPLPGGVIPRRLRDLIVKHKQIIADIGFLCAVTTAEEWGKAGPVLSDLNDALAQLAFSLEAHDLPD